MPHLERFGAIEIPARHYLLRLDEALSGTGDFPLDPAQDLVDKAIEDVLNG